jgi:glucosamine-phosphate N-acetyltransferase
MIIRKLNIYDYDQFLILIKQFRPTEFTKQQFLDRMNYIKNYSDIWVIEENKQLVATATIIYEQKFIHNLCILAHVEDVCVREDFRGKGFGKILMNHLEQQAKEKGCYKITLVCSQENSEFYEKCDLEVRGLQMSQLTELL